MVLNGLGESSAFIASYNPDSVWTAEMHLLASVLDTLAVANWQRGGDPKAPKPTPLKRPGVKTGEHYGNTVKPLADMQAFFKRRGQRWRQN